MFQIGQFNFFAHGLLSTFFFFFHGWNGYTLSVPTVKKVQKIAVTGMKR